MSHDETPFADQVERELKAVYEFWESFRTNPVVLALAARIQQAKEGA
jgi:hypothetical protein